MNPIVYAAQNDYIALCANAPYTPMLRTPKENVVILMPENDAINPIKEALKYCSKEINKEDELKNVLKEIDKLEKEQEFLDRKHSQLLSIERLAKTEISERIKFIKERLPNLIRSKITLKYPKLSLDVFYWRDVKGWPRFAIFDACGPASSCVIDRGGRRFGGLVIHNEISGRLSVPEWINTAMLSGIDQDVLRGKSLQMDFKGIIPDDVRKKIVIAEKEFEQLKHRVYIVAEAAWEENLEKPWNPDPLVIGWDGEDCRLIASFDLTTLENYIKSEFTS